MKYEDRWTVSLAVDDEMLSERTCIPLAVDSVVAPPPPFRATLTFCYLGQPVFVMRSGTEPDEPSLELAAPAGRNEINPLLALVFDANSRGKR